MLASVQAYPMHTHTLTHTCARTHTHTLTQARARRRQTAPLNAADSQQPLLSAQHPPSGSDESHAHTGTGAASQQHNVHPQQHNVHPQQQNAVQQGGFQQHQTQQSHQHSQLGPSTKSLVAENPDGSVWVAVSAAGHTNTGHTNTGEGVQGGGERGDAFASGDAAFASGDAAATSCSGSGSSELSGRQQNRAAAPLSVEEQRLRAWDAEMEAAEAAIESLVRFIVVVKRMCVCVLECRAKQMNEPHFFCSFFALPVSSGVCTASFPQNCIPNKALALTCLQLIKGHMTLVRAPTQGYEDYDVAGGYGDGISETEAGVLPSYVSRIPVSSTGAKGDRKNGDTRCVCVGVCIGLCIRVCTCLNVH